MSSLFHDRNQILSEADKRSIEDAGFALDVAVLLAHVREKKRIQPDLQWTEFEVQVNLSFMLRELYRHIREMGYEPDLVLRDLETNETISITDLKKMES